MKTETHWVVLSAMKTRMTTHIDVCSNSNKRLYAVKALNDAPFHLEISLIFLLYRTTFGWICLPSAAFLSASEQVEQIQHRAVNIIFLVSHVEGLKEWDYQNFSKEGIIVQVLQKFSITRS